MSKSRNEEKSFCWNSGIGTISQNCRLVQTQIRQSLDFTKFCNKVNLLPVAEVEHTWINLSSPQFGQIGIWLETKTLTQHHPDGKDAKRKHVKKQNWTHSNLLSAMCCYLPGQPFRCFDFPGVRSRCLSVRAYKTFLKLCWYDSGWWWYQLNASWWCQ